ncbi:MAG: hypothetical protein V4504_01760 [Patescibacteria group bacterium]
MSITQKSQDLTEDPKNLLPSQKKEIEQLENELFPKGSLPEVTQLQNKSAPIRQLMQNIPNAQLVRSYKEAFGEESIKVSVNLGQLRTFPGRRPAIGNLYSFDYRNEDIRQIHNEYKDLPYNLFDTQTFTNLQEYLMMAYSQRSYGKVLDKKSKSLTYLQDMDCNGHMLIAYIAKKEVKDKPVLHISTDCHRREEFGFIPFENSVIRPIMLLK